MQQVYVREQEKFYMDLRDACDVKYYKDQWTLYHSKFIETDFK